MDRVTVYRFKLNEAETDPNRDAKALAPRAATAETIAKITGATLVAESARVVDRHCLDSHGFLDQR